MALFSRRLAPAAIVIAGLVSGVCIITAFVAMRRVAEAPVERQPAVEAVTGTEHLLFDEFNFRFARPKDPWEQVEARQVNPDSVLAFALPRPQMAFIALAEAPGIERQADLATFKDIVLANHKSLWQSVVLRESRPETRSGVAGERIVVEVGDEQKKLTYVSWLGVHHGFAYELQVFSSAANAAALQRAGEELFGRFALLDPNRIAHGGKPIEDFHSPRHGYTLRLAGTNWQPWDNLRELLPDAECGAMIGNYARCAVIPMSCLGRQPRLEAITAALVARLGIAYSATQARNLQSVPGLSGQRFEMSREIAGRQYNYHFQVIERAGRGYLVAAWADAAAPKGTAAQLEAVLARFELQSAAPSSMSQPDELTLDEKQSHAQLFNDLGLYHFNSRLFSESADYFRQAFELLENDPMLLDNVASAYIELNRFGEGRDYLAKHLHRFSDRHDLKSRYAFLQGKSGDVDAAIKTYGELFAAGYRGDQALQDYIEYLIQRDRPDEALAQVQQYLAHSGSPPSQVARRLEAMLYSRKGEHARAVSVLKDLRKDGAFDPELAYDLADTYLAAQQFHDGLAVCRELLDRRYDTPYTYFLKGRLELGLKWYAAAKMSFEAALRSDRSNQTTRTYLDQVSGLLGEGDNSSIKDPIEPVPIPAQIAELPTQGPADAFKDQYGACFLQRIEAVDFDPARQVKRTTRQVVKLFDASGVRRFSTFQLQFDPLAEQVYVNRLRITNAEGKEVGFGKPSDFFVIDDGEGGIASQRKVLHVPVPGLAPGCTIELIYTRRDLVSPQDFPYIEHYFTADVPILSETMYVRAAPAAFVSRASAGLAPESVEGGQVWTVSRPPVHRHEPMQAPLDAFVPHLLLGAPGQSWPELATAYLKSIDDRLQIEPSTRSLAEQSTVAATSDEQKAAALVQLVRDQLAYRAIEFGRRARVPNKVPTILANRYGDCKDHSLLLAQLLQVSGIDAHLALIRLDRTPDESLPSLDQFDHMIVFAPKLGAGRFFDCTDKESPFSQPVPRGLAARPAYVLDPQNPRFVTLPAYPADSNLVNSQRTVRLVGEADLAIEETLRLEGYLAATLRGLLKEVQPANRVAVLQTQLSAGAGETLQIQKVEIENLEDKSAPLVLKTDCLVKGKFHTVGESLVGQVPALWERFFLNAQRVENRQTPFVARYPLRIKSAITLDLPDGFTTGDMGALNREEQSSFAEWKLSAADKDNALQLGFEATRGVGQYTSDQYGAYCDSMERTVGALAQNVVLRRVQKQSP
jgi:predicted Zn-dependent protease